MAGNPEIRAFFGFPPIRSVHVKSRLSCSPNIMLTAARTLRSPLLAGTKQNLRRISTTPLRGSTASPQQQPRNEAEEYLANKAARRQQRKADPTSARARHASFYTDIVPALLRVLAYGSASYFALHLLWNLLDRDEQRQLMAKQAGQLQDRIHSVTKKVHAATSSRVPSSAIPPEDQTPRKRSWWPF